MSAICSRPAGIWCAACHSVAPEAQVSGLISRRQGKKIFTSWVSAVISLVPRACLSLNLPTTCDHTLKQQNVWSIIRMFQDSARFYKSNLFYCVQVISSQVPVHRRRLNNRVVHNLPIFWLLTHKICSQISTLLGNGFIVPPTLSGLISEPF